MIPRTLDALRSRAGGFVGTRLLRAGTAVSGAGYRIGRFGAWLRDAGLRCYVWGDPGPAFVVMDLSDDKADGGPRCTCYDGDGVWVCPTCRGEDADDANESDR